LDTPDVAFSLTPSHAVDGGRRHATALIRTLIKTVDIARNPTTVALLAYKFSVVSLTFKNRSV